MMAPSRPPRVFIGNARSGSAEAARETLTPRLGADDRWQQTEDLEALREALQAAAEANATAVIVGGDGSLRCAVELVVAHAIDVVLGLIPAGTGNDLARTLGIPLDVEEALTALDRATPRALDVIEAWDASGTLLGRGVNAAIGGESARANDDLDEGLKARLGKLALWLRQPAELASVAPVEVTVTLDDGPPETTRLIGLVAASGATVGGGMVVADGADPTDGLLDVLLVTHGDPVSLASAAAALVAGTLAEHALVRRAFTARIGLEPAGALPVSLDGDLVEGAVARITLRPGAVRVATPEP